MVPGTRHGPTGIPHLQGKLQSRDGAVGAPQRCL